MLKKMTGNVLKNDQMKNVNGSGGSWLFWKWLDAVLGDDCKDYCRGRCGTKTDSDDNHESGQSAYQ